jgi:hypothetical protein
VGGHQVMSHRRRKKAAQLSAGSTPSELAPAILLLIQVCTPYAKSLLPSSYLLFVSVFLSSCILLFVRARTLQMNTRVFSVFFFLFSGRQKSFIDMLLDS